MKKFVILFNLMLIGYVGNSQIIIPLLFGDKLNQNEYIEFGIQGGVNFSTISGLDKPGFIFKPNLGIYFDIQLKNTPWTLHFGAFPVSTMGAGKLSLYELSNNDLNGVFQGGEVKRVFNYVSVPLLVKYRFKIPLFLEAGPQLGYMYHATDKFLNEVENPHDLMFFKNVNSQYRKLDFGLTAGIGYRIPRGNGVNLSARYYHGLVNIAKDKSLPSQYNKSIYLVVGFPVGAGKNPK